MNSRSVRSVRSVCASRVALGTAHCHHDAVTTRESCYYSVGQGEVTEIRASGLGFQTFRWLDAGGGNVHLAGVSPIDPSSSVVWRNLERDVLTGKARLSNRESVRGVGGTPAHRAEARATDGLAAVCHWLRRAEARIDAQRAKILAANKLLANGPTANISESPVAPAFGVARLYDSDGAISVRGKRTSGGSVERVFVSMKDRSARLRESAELQLQWAAEVAGDAAAEAAYLAMAEKSESRANALDSALRERTKAARAALAAKRKGTVTVAAEAVIVLATCEDRAVVARDAAKGKDMEA